MAVHRPLFEPERRADPATDRRLAFGVFAPPLAWFAQEIIGVSIVGRHCAAADGLTGTGWTVLVVTWIVAAVIAIAAGMIAYGVFKRQPRTGSLSEAEGWGRVEFVALLGIFVSALLLLNIVYFGVMPFVVEPCARTI